MAKYGIVKYGDVQYGPTPVPGGLASVGNRINLSSISTVSNSIGTTHFRNQFDELGDLVSLRRIQGEHNHTFRRRIQDAMVHYANSSYQGMIYGITRDLGLSLYSSIIVNPKVDINGKFLAPDPYIRFEGPYLYLYSDYANGLLDWAIDRFEPGGNYEHVGRLVQMINNTTFFEAGTYPGQGYFDRSMAILNQSNREVVTFERVQASKKFTLRNNRIVSGSLFFSNRDVFKTEVATGAAVVAHGQYNVDYHSGIVKVFTIPTISDTVRYRYVKYPFVTMASPVIVHDITSENFRAKMFGQVLQDDGTYAHGLPTELGVDLINELLTVVPMYWGI